MRNRIIDISNEDEEESVCTQRVKKKEMDAESTLQVQLFFHGTAQPCERNNPTAAPSVLRRGESFDALAPPLRVPTGHGPASAVGIRGRTGIRSSSDRWGLFF